jgi:hypothetical protein
VNSDSTKTDTAGALDAANPTDGPDPEELQARFIEGTVIEELRYRIRDEALRPSLVRIARRPAQDGAHERELEARRPRQGSG